MWPIFTKLLWNWWHCGAQCDREQKCHIDWPWKCWVTSEIRIPFCFLLYQEKVDIELILFGNKDDGHWPWCRRIRIPVDFFYYLLSSVRFDVESVYKYSRFKTEYFCKFWSWPTFSRSYVIIIGWPDTVQSFCWKLDWNWLYDGEGFQRFFPFFQNDAFSSWKMETKLCENFLSCRTLSNRPRVGS